MIYSLNPPPSICFVHFGESIYNVVTIVYFRARGLLFILNYIIKGIRGPSM